MPMDKKEFEAVIQSIKDNTCGKTLHLTYKSIDATQASALATALASNATVQELRLGLNQIGDVGAGALAKALVTNTTVQRLELRNNQIGAAGAEALGKALATNTTVRELYLVSNQIGAAGAEVLAKALATNTTVEKLDLRRNQIGDAGAEALAKALASNTTVQRLYLGDNQIGAAGAGAAAVKAMQEALERNQALAAKQSPPFAALPMTAPAPAPSAQSAVTALAKPAPGVAEAGFAPVSYTGAGPGPSVGAGAGAPSPLPINAVPAAVASPYLEIKQAAETAAAAPGAQSKVGLAKPTSAPTPEVKAAVEATKMAALPTIPRIAWNQLTLGDLIGNGSYGEVYKGKWQGVPIAVKQLQLKTLSPAMTQEFEKESDMMMQCQFPSVVRLYGICTEPGHFAMVMEYLPMSLRQRLQEDKPLSWMKRLTLALEIAQGLAYLHNRNILHRDLKSLNILLDANEHAKIADFGLAKVKLEVGSASTKSHKAVGSIRWRAPELFKRHAIATPASDVYSLGMLFWELASRQLPYSDAADEVTAMGFIKDGEQEKIPEDCHKVLAELIQACWSAPDKRPTAAEVVARLEAAIALEERAAKETESKKSLDKPWHFDSSLKPAPGTMTKDYVLIPAGEKDIRKVMTIYHQSPIPGYEIRSVNVIYNPSFNRIFTERLHTLQRRFGKPAFQSNWHLEKNSEWRKEIHNMFETMAKPNQDKDFPNVSINFMWHGTKSAILPSLLETGFANVSQKTDVGYFGNAPFYGTPDAWYAHKFYFKGAMVLTCTAHFSLYPVIDGDMDKLKGKNNYQNYDVHGVPVVPASSDEDDASYFPTKPGEKPKSSEIAVFDSGQVIPRYVVEFQEVAPSKPLANPAGSPNEMLYAFLASKYKPKAAAGAGAGAAVVVTKDDNKAAVGAGAGAKAKA